GWTIVMPRARTRCGIGSRSSANRWPLPRPPQSNATAIPCTCTPTTPGRRSKRGWWPGSSAGASSRRGAPAAPGRPGAGGTRERAVLAVVDGDGAASLFSGEGATVLQPDPETDISAHQLVRAVVDTAAAQVMVLPNGYVAAEELVAGCTAATGWGIDVVPI